MPHAKHLKIAKYSHLEASHHSVPSAVETSGVLGQAALDLIDDIGRHFHQMMGEPRSKEYLLQRLSIAIQRGMWWRCWGLWGGEVNGTPFGGNCCMYACA